MSLIRKIFGEGTRKFLFRHATYNQYGLLYHDVMRETPDVVEAVRRLPPNIRDERVFRIIRAHQLCVEHTVLPKEQWTKYEDDVRYLTPYLDEVRREKKEREMWDKAH